MLRLWDSTTNEFECLSAASRSSARIALVGDDAPAAVTPGPHGITRWMQRVSHRLWGARPDGLDSV